MRTYGGLSTVAPKLRRLLKEFRFSTLTAVYPAGGHAGITEEIAVAPALPATSVS
jgi:hypothetical protein